jgi:hypothetical protein
MIKYVYWFIGFHAKYLSFFFDFNETWIFPTKFIGFHAKYLSFLFDFNETWIFPAKFIGFHAKYLSFLFHFNETWIFPTKFIGFHAKYLSFLFDFNETWIFPTKFRKKYSNVKFHENPSKGSPVVSCERIHTDRRTDMTKLIVGFRSSANAPINGSRTQQVRQAEHRDVPKKEIKIVFMSRCTNQLHSTQHLSQWQTDRNCLNTQITFLISSSLSSTKRIIGSGLRNVECQRISNFLIDQHNHIQITVLKTMDTLQKKNTSGHRTLGWTSCQ